MADASAVLLGRPVSEGAGECHVDADVLRAAGVTDLFHYAADGAAPDALEPDLFL